MSATTQIEWTGGTWNPVMGCTKVSAECDQRYGERFAARFRGVRGHPLEPELGPTLRLDGRNEFSGKGGR